MSNGDLWGYVILVAAGIGYVIYRRRAKTLPTPPNTEPEPPVDVPDPVGDQPHTALPGPLVSAEPKPEPEPELRRLDRVYIRCENTTHSPDTVPTLTLTRDRIVAVALTLQRQGWTNTPNATLCPVHNPLGHELTAVHIRCDTPGCGERAPMRLTDLSGAFSRCHFDGWRNRGPQVICPYCSGVREHRNS